MGWVSAPQPGPPAGYYGLGQMASRRDICDVVGAGGLIPAGSTVLVLLSGGGDSVCLLHVLHELVGPARVAALHVNHGLREQADADQAFCEQLCERLSIPLHVERLEIAPGRATSRPRPARLATGRQSRCGPIGRST